MRKKRLALLASIITITTIPLFIVILAFPHNASSEDINPPQNTPDTNPPKGPLLTVPENPFGVLGLMSAIVLAFIASYAFSKKLPSPYHQ
jgi:hypothetical protein